MYKRYMFHFKCVEKAIQFLFIVEVNTLKYNYYRRCYNIVKSAQIE